MRLDRQLLLRLPGGRLQAERARDLPRLIASSALLTGAAAPIMATAARRISATSRHRLERRWARSAVRFLNVDLTIDGLEHIAREEAYVVAPLHEGFADALALLHLPLDLRFVARSELADWRVLGRYLHASDQILVEPESPVTAYRRVLEAAQTTLDGGESVVVFPQGTILGIESAFNGAAFRVARRTSKRLLPVVLTGAHRVWDHPYSNVVRFGQRMRMTVLPPIEAAEAVARAKELERTMKEIALAGDPPPRRFVPERDGWWDGYRYEIDPAFTDLADRVARHRRRSSPPIDTPG